MPGQDRNIRVVIDDLHSPEITSLLEAHLEFCRRHSPPGSVHALDIEGLRAADIIFWAAWRESQLLGCIALHELDAAHGEIKSMHTAEAARGQGIGRKLVIHLIDTARQRAYERLSLETGTMAAFEPARLLYQSFGFEECPPFADYFVDPNSVCMTKTLSSAE